MNHFLLRLLADGIGPELEGRRLGDVRLLPPVLSAELSREGESRYGVVILSMPGPFFYLDTEDPITGLGTTVFRRIRNFAVSRVDVPTVDRVIRLALVAPRERLTLSVTLYGSAARVRVEGRDTVIESLDARETGGPLPPPTTGHGPALADVGVADFAQQYASNDVAERAIPGLTRELLESFQMSEGGIDISRLLLFRDGLLRGAETFFLATRRRAGSASPVPSIPSAGPEPVTVALGPFNKAEEACRETGRAMLRSLKDALVERCAAPLKKHLSARRRLLSVLEEERVEAESFAAVRREANILASYRSRVPPGAREVVLPDLYGSGDLTIRLDPAVPIQEQIERRFRLAAKLDRKRGIIDKRLCAVEAEVTKLEQELAAVRNEPKLLEAVSRIERAKRRAGVEEAADRIRRVKPRPRQLRRFDLDPQWFVLVGRSDRENDEITFRIAAPDDIWLHSQHTAGSHVILKSRGTRANPPAAVLEAAAGIAAHYSKGRHASVVPVIYTRRKYVRKFRNAKPGQVICEREKTILAEPRLPKSGVD